MVQASQYMLGFGRYVQSHADFPRQRPACSSCWSINARGKLDIGARLGVTVRPMIAACQYFTVKAVAAIGGTMTVKEYSSARAFGLLLLLG